MSNQNSRPDESNRPHSSDQVRNQGVPLQGYPSAPPGPIVTEQPISVVSSIYQGWTTIPLPMPTFNFPSGLDHLNTLDELLVQQQVETKGCKELQSTNRFQIKNPSDQTVYFAIEDSTYLSRICCNTIHPFTMKLLDNIGSEILHFRRQCSCNCCSFFRNSQKLEVFSSSGAFLGVVQQESSFLYPSFAIKNSSKITVLRVRGPWCWMMCDEVCFKITSVDGNVELGAITKKWRGFCTEITLDANNFEIVFPTDLDVKIKAVVLGACFFINVLFFEL